MPKPPAISIITPVWNGIPYLRECVDSAMSQEFQNWELLISDNGSTDGTRDYLDSLSDPRIRVFKQEKNLGIFGNLNFLFSQAKAPFAQILCADDQFTDNGSLGKIMDFWNHAPEPTSFARMNWIAEKYPKPYFRMMRESLLQTYSAHNAFLVYYCFGNVMGNLTNATLRTDVARRHLLFDQSYPYAGDHEFWLRAARKFQFTFINEKLTCVRSHSDQASNYLNKNGQLPRETFLVADLCIKAEDKIANTSGFRMHFTACIYGSQMQAELSRMLKSRNFSRYVEFERTAELTGHCFIFPFRFTIGILTSLFTSIRFRIAHGFLGSLLS